MAVVRRRLGQHRQSLGALRIGGVLMFTPEEIEASVAYAQRRAAENGHNTLVLMQADYQDGKFGGSLYLYQKAGDNFGVGAFLHFDSTAKVEGGVEARLSF